MGSSVGGGISFELKRKVLQGSSGFRSDIVEVGDVVLLKSNQSRSYWPVAKIISLHPDQEKVIRIVKVLSRLTSVRSIN